MRIQHNIMAMNSYRNYNNNVKALSGNLEKLSSGYKINRAGDDAAGLAISEKMRAQITGLEAAQKNVKDGVSLVKTAEGAMQEIQDMLNRMSYLATQSANGTYDKQIDRANLQKEVESLKTEINRIADSANFNGINLLDGTQAGGSVGFTQATSKTAASFTVTITATGEELIGGSIQIGNTSLQVKEAAAGATAAAKIDGNVLFVTKAAKASEIATAVVEHDNIAEISVKDTSGETQTLKASAASGVITYAMSASGSGVNIKVTTLPMATINSGLQLQIGDTSDAFNQMRVGINNMHTANLLLDGTTDISTQDGAAKAVDYIKNAINMVSSTRGDLGAIQNRLEHTQNNLSVMAENITDAESTIRDTDVADEMMKYTKNNILIQSAQAMLAQANQVPQGVLQLLQ